MITLRFHYNPVTETANNPQICAHKRFPATTVKSVSAAWNLIRKYRDEAPEVVENEILEVTADEGTDLSRIPATIIFKRNTKGKLEFKDLQKIRERAAKKEMAEAEKNAISSESIQTAEELNEDYPDQGEENMEKDLALSSL